VQAAFEPQKAACTLKNTTTIPQTPQRNTAMTIIKQEDFIQSIADAFQFNQRLPGFDVFAVLYGDFFDYGGFQRLDGFTAAVRSGSAFCHRNNIDFSDQRPQQRQERKQHNQPCSPFGCSRQRGFDQFQMGGQKSTLVLISHRWIKLGTYRPNIAPNSKITGKEFFIGLEADTHGGSFVKI